MKRRLVLVALLLALPAILFWVAFPMAHWRPLVIGSVRNLENIQLSPDGGRLLSTSAAPSYPNQEFQLWDVASRRAMYRFGATEVWWSADNRFLVASQKSEDKNDGTIYRQQSLRIFDAPSGETLREWKQLPFQGEEVVNDVRFENGGRELLVATPFRVWRMDVASGKLLSRVNLQIQYQRDPQQSTPPNFQSFVDAGRKLFYCNVGDVFLLDATTGKRLKKLDAREGVPILAPDGQTVLDFEWETGATRALDVSTGKVLWQQHMSHPFFSPGGENLLSANGPVHLFDARTGKLLRKLDVPFSTDEQPQYALSPDGEFVFASEAGKIIRYRIR